MKPSLIPQDSACSDMVQCLCACLSFSTGQQPLEGRAPPQVPVLVCSRHAKNACLVNESDAQFMKVNGEKIVGRDTRSHGLSAASVNVAPTRERGSRLYVIFSCFYQINMTRLSTVGSPTDSSALFPDSTRDRNNALVSLWCLHHCFSNANLTSNHLGSC